MVFKKLADPVVGVAIGTFAAWALLPVLDDLVFLAVPEALDGANGFRLDDGNAVGGAGDVNGDWGLPVRCYASPPRLVSRPAPDRRWSSLLEVMTP